MIREKPRSATTPSGASWVVATPSNMSFSKTPSEGARVAATPSTRSSRATRTTGYQDDGGDPRHQILFSSLQIEGKHHREPDEQEGFFELLEKLSSAHDGEIRRAVERLESEKAELEQQNNMLRSQLVEMRWNLQHQAQPTRSERKRTHFAVSPSRQLEEPAKPKALPSMIDLSDCDGVTPGGSSRDHGPAEDSERDGDGADDEKSEGGEEHFPPRSEYTKELVDTLELRSRSMNCLDHIWTVSKTVSETSRDRRAKLNLRSYNGFMASYIASPRSNVRTAWEVVGCVLIGWDLLVVPLAVFCYPLNGVTMTMEWMTLVYWTLNIPQTLTVGYEVGLGTVMCPSAILMSYLKGWFLIDMAILVPDWIIVVIGLGSSKERITSCDSAVEGAGAVKLLKKLRILRLMRLTRIARLKKMWQMVKDMIYSLTVSIVVNILTMLLLLLVISHFISCLWYTVGDHVKGDNRWIVYYNLQGLDWSYLYATCLHWSLTQFTPAPMDIQPQNLPERIFTISVVVCALVGFSYVVGSITGSLAQLRSVTEEESKLFWDLRVYLKRNVVEHTLAVRIQRYLSYAWRCQAYNKTFSQIKILSMLSDQLQNELLYHLHADHLNVYPLIHTLLDVSPVTAFRLARTAISTKQFAKHDPLFIYGEKPSHMYIVILGQFEYKRITSEEVAICEMVDKGEDWIAEPVLWSTEWYHLGDCTAVDTSSLMLVNPHHFCEEARRNPPAWALVTTYCRNFLKWLNSVSPDDLSDITQGDHLDKTALLKSFMVVNSDSISYSAAGA